MYELLDFGAGRKLERFGELVIDRPAPAADYFRVARPELWKTAVARFDRERGCWQGDLPQAWEYRHDELRFQLRATSVGQVGLFPEQAGNWSWIADTVRRSPAPTKVLNLFAYTGGSTLAAATAGAEVTHIDAAKSAVQWARQNAELSGLAQHPIRWIAEDAVKFVERELKREREYHAVILDPPSYGHGPQGQPWKLDDDLPRLLERCAQLINNAPAFILLTCHSPGYEADILADLLQAQLGNGAIESGDLVLRTSDGRELPSGHYARWIAPH